MSSTKLDFVSDSSQAQREIDKLNRSIAGLKEQMRQMKDESKRGAAEAGSAFESAAESVTEIATGLFSVGAAVGAATKFYSDWRAETDRLVQSHDNLSQSVVKTLAESGRLAQAPAVQAWLGSLRGVTAAQGTAAFGGVVQAAPGLSQDRQFAIAAEVARLAPTGVDLARTGGVAGDVAQILGDEAAPGDVADVAVGLRRLLGDKVSEFGGNSFQRQIEALKSSGMSGTDALANAVAALRSDQRGDALNLLTGGKLSPQDAARRDAIFAPDVVAGIASELRGFQTGDAAAGELSALASSALTKPALQEQAVAVATDASVLAAGPAAELARTREFIAAKAWQRGRGAWAMTRLEQGMARVGEALGADAFSPANRNAAQQELEQATAMGRITPAERDEMLGKLVQALENNTLATQRNTQTAAPRKNVDAHTE